MSEFSDQYFRDLAPGPRRFDTPVSDQLVFCVFPNGVKSWVFLYDADGHVRRRTIGLFPDMGYEDALRALDPNRRITALDASEQREQGGRRPAAALLDRVRPLLSRISLRDVLAAGGTAVVAFTALVLIGGRESPAPEPAPTAAAPARQPATDAGERSPGPPVAGPDGGAAPVTAGATTVPAPVPAPAAVTATPGRGTIEAAPGSAGAPGEADDDAFPALDDFEEDTSGTAAAAFSEPPPEQTGAGGSADISPAPAPAESGAPLPGDPGNVLGGDFEGDTTDAAPAAFSEPPPEQARTGADASAGPAAGEPADGEPGPASGPADAGPPPAGEGAGATGPTAFDDDENTTAAPAFSEPPPEEAPAGEDGATDAEDADAPDPAREGE